MQQDNDVNLTQSKGASSKGVSSNPFAHFLEDHPKQGHLRSKITNYYRISEEECVPFLLDQAELDELDKQRIYSLSLSLATVLRAKQKKGNFSRALDGLAEQYSLSTEEGVALMCLAESLLRIPDAKTRNLLISEKIGTSDWKKHLGKNASFYVNAATWCLLLTGKVVNKSDGILSEENLSKGLKSLFTSLGEPLILKAVNTMITMMGKRYIVGETIGDAVSNNGRNGRHRFARSYDMLGEAALTEKDAEHYTVAYMTAIHAIGKDVSAQGKTLFEKDNVSIKLSALHPRYTRSQKTRVMDELYNIIKRLALLAKGYNIGISIDAEESERLDLSLDLLEKLCQDPDLADWDGLGFVVQAYQKRAYSVIEYLIHLSKTFSRTLMVRLVKGAYWDGEIKKCQITGVSDFPVFTRKSHTDLSYIACAKLLLNNDANIYPQFATHNARTLATVHAMTKTYQGEYEFQFLHGMGEGLYEAFLEKEPEVRCRVYAPVGAYESLLAYLVRRLLENGANTSFVNQLLNPDCDMDELIMDPAERVKQITPIGKSHPKILRPKDLFPNRKNSSGLDLSNEEELGTIFKSLKQVGEKTPYRIAPEKLDLETSHNKIVVVNPADHRDILGEVTLLNKDDLEQKIQKAQKAFASWSKVSFIERVSCLKKAADDLEQNRTVFLSLLIREAGKSIANADAEVREAIDFLRYYSVEAQEYRLETHHPLGVVACISPWNFPLAIYLGQIVASLAAGNVVLAKPSEETLIIAHEANALLHRAGIPKDVLQYIPGKGDLGAGLVQHPAINAVLFTGSTGVARSIRKNLSTRLNENLRPIPLIAETSGQNAMIVDSTALLEQVVQDVIYSAFDSSGQRCSALRVLCVQDDIADRCVDMLIEATKQYRLGNPCQFSVDIGPVIHQQAKDGIENYIAQCEEQGRVLFRYALEEHCSYGTFVAPTLIEIENIQQLGQEVFGPVLHVLRYSSDQLSSLVHAINSTGYALTFGLHTRLEHRIKSVSSKTHAGNVYINRNIVGAVVGVQPFGGHSLSGTGPKAGGPLFLRRLLKERPMLSDFTPKRSHLVDLLLSWVDQKAILSKEGRAELEAIAKHLPYQALVALPGPVGESNTYQLCGKGLILCISNHIEHFIKQILTCLASDNLALCVIHESYATIVEHLPHELRACLSIAETLETALSNGSIKSVLYEGTAEQLLVVEKHLAERTGELVQVHVAIYDPQAKMEYYPYEWMYNEKTICENTTAIGGNAKLMSELNDRE